MLKKICVSAILVAAMTSALWAQNPPAGSPIDKHGALRVSGNKIVDKNGNPVTLRGMSFFWNTPGWGGDKYYTAGVVNELANDWKVSVLRVAVEPEKTSDANWKTVTDAALAKGIYVIIDFHAHSHQLSGSAKTFFEGLSATYGNKPGVIYEIFNEPCPAANTYTIGGGGCKGDDWVQHVKPYAETVVGAIRAKGDTNIVIIGTPNYSKRVDIAAKNKVTAGSGKNLAYAVHFYTGEKDPYNSEHKERLRTWCREALADGVALFASEFGLSEPGGGLEGQGETNILGIEEAERWMKFMDDNHIGWAMWSVNDKEEAASALKKGAPTTGSWTTGSSATCNAANGTTPVYAQRYPNGCQLHGQLACAGFYIRNKLRYYATPLTLSATAAGPGKVTVSPQSANYSPTQTITLTAVPDAGARFEGWSRGIGGVAINSPTASLTFTRDTVVNAVFFTSNLLTNSTFTIDQTGWSTAGTGIGIQAVNGEGRVSVAAGSSADGRLQQQNVRLENGKKYNLTFDAKAVSGTRTITPAFRGGGLSVPWVEAAPITLTATMQPFKVVFDMNSPTATNAIIAFNCGGQTGDWIIDNVSLLEDGKSSPVSHAAVSAAPFRAAFNGHALTLTGTAGKHAEVTVFDMAGRVRLSRSVSLSSGSAQVSLDRLPAGMYSVRYRVDGKAAGANERIMIAR